MRGFAFAVALACTFTSGCGDWSSEDDDGGDDGGGSDVVVVDSGGDHGVVRFSSVGSTGSVVFESGPAVPPFGVGSAEFRTGSDGDSGEELRFDVLDGVPLGDVTLLSYWTYVDVGSGDQGVYLGLRIDWDDDGIQDDRIFFEPEYQHGYTGDVPDQGALVVGAWQRWDARQGGWWSVFDPAIGPGADVASLAEYLAAHPLATVVAGPDGTGGLRMVAGYGAPPWTDFVGNADALEVGVLGDVRTFDLDP